MEALEALLQQVQISNFSSASIVSQHQTPRFVLIRIFRKSWDHLSFEAHGKLKMDFWMNLRLLFVENPLSLTTSYRRFSYHISLPASILIQTKTMFQMILNRRAPLT